jgi:hypothetical protein
VRGWWALQKVIAEGIARPMLAGVLGLRLSRIDAHEHSRSSDHRIHSATQLLLLRVIESETATRDIALKMLPARLCVFAACVQRTLEYLMLLY